MYWFPSSNKKTGIYFLLWLMGTKINIVKRNSRMCFENIFKIWNVDFFKIPKCSPITHDKPKFNFKHS